MIEGLAACFAGLADPRAARRCDHRLGERRPLGLDARQRSRRAAGTGRTGGIRKNADRGGATPARGTSSSHLTGREAEEVADALGMRHVPLRSATAEEIEARASGLPVA